MFTIAQNKCSQSPEYSDRASCQFWLIATSLKYFPLSGIQYRQVPGQIVVEVPIIAEYVPDWVVQNMQRHDQSYAKGESITLLSLDVVRPGVIKAQGLWSEESNAVVITNDKLFFITPSQEGCLCLLGDGEESVLQYAGPISAALFNFK